MLNGVRVVMLSLSLCLILLAGCTESNGDGDQGSGGSGEPSVNGDTLSCGVVDDGSVKNEIADISSTPVIVTQAIGPELVAVRPVDSEPRGDILIQLQGVREKVATRGAALTALQALIGRQAALVNPGPDCDVVVSGGGRGRLASLITAEEKSVTETLVAAGVVDVAQADICGGALLAPCLNSLQGTNQVIAGELERFLWKPVSESDGNLAIHTSPFGTNVTVNGELGTNQGPGNGYGSLARFRQPGCAYGKASISVTDATSGLPYTFQGATSFTILDPCQRNCIEGGVMKFCPKN